MFKQIGQRQISSSFIGKSTKRLGPLKIAVCGGAGRIGQLISLFLRKSNFDLKISISDITTNLENVTKQLHMISAKNKVEEYIGPLKLRMALKDSDVVVIALESCGRAADEFNLNLSPVGSTIKTCIDVCPEAIIALVTTPLNFLIPAVHEIYQQHGVESKHKVFGVVSTDAMIASVVYSDMFLQDPTKVFIPITGGTTLETVLPLFSQAIPSLSQELITSESELFHNKFLEYKSKTQYYEMTTVVAIMRFIKSVIRAILGEKDVVEMAFVATPTNSSVKYTTSLVELNENGIQTVYSEPTSLNRFEKKLYYPAMMSLQRDITFAERYMTTWRQKETRTKGF